MEDFMPYRRLRRLEDAQKKAASTLLRQACLLALAGVGYQYISGSFWDVTALTILATVSGFLSVDILKGLKHNEAERGDDE